MNLCVAVVGSTGQLGSDLVRVFCAEGHEVFPLSHADIECTDFESVQCALAAIRPGVVINCASFVRVDDCEDQPDQAFQVNAIGALNVARACAELDALCVYISTDYVFDGETRGSYTVEDVTNPINVYGTSKLAGEYMVRQSSPRWLIARVASLFGKVGARGKGGNFVETILDRARAGQPLRVVDDVCMSPTYTYDAARALERLLKQGATGVYHLTNSGVCSWHEFAAKSVELAGLDSPVEAVSSAEYLTKARRPVNSALSNRSLDPSVKEILRPWPEALQAYLVEKGYPEGKSFAESHNRIRP